MGKRNGLRQKVRDALPDTLVVFLKKKGALCKFIDNYIYLYLRGYIEQERVLNSDVKSKSALAFLGITFTWSSTPEGHAFWNKLYDKFRDECDKRS